MSMFSELIHKEYAKEYGELILKAFNSPDWRDVRSACRGFAWKEIYPKYLAACDGAMMSPDPEITKLFANEKSTA